MCLSLQQSGHEPVYVKEAFARVTVELAKHMWPQRWGSFINDMDTLAKCGVSFTMQVHFTHLGWKEMCKRAVYNVQFILAGQDGQSKSNLIGHLKDCLAISVSLDFIESVSGSAKLPDELARFLVLYLS